MSTLQIIGAAILYFFVGSIAGAAWSEHEDTGSVHVWASIFLWPLIVVIFALVKFFRWVRVTP